MADEYTVTTQNSGSAFEPAPEGLQQVVCVDGIYLGHTVDQFQNNAPKLVEKYALVFQSAETTAAGKRAEIHREFTVSMGAKANLRKFLASWRGKAYTDEEAKKVPLHKVVGHNGLATVEHRTSAAGNTYAVISNISPLMKGTPTIAPEAYERAPFWEERKAEYKAKADAFLAAQATQAAHDEHVGPGVGDEDDDSSLPF